MLAFLVLARLVGNGSLVQVLDFFKQLLSVLVRVGSSAALGLGLDRDVIISLGIVLGLSDSGVQKSG